MKYRAVIIDPDAVLLQPDDIGTARIVSPPVMNSQTLQPVLDWAVLELSKAQYERAWCCIYVTEERLLDTVARNGSELVTRCSNVALPTLAEAEKRVAQL